MKIKKIKFDKIKSFLIELPKILGKRAFLTFLGLLFIFLIFGALLFYKYVFLIEKMEPEMPEAPLKIDEAILQKILKQFEEKKIKLKETESKQYPDPFTRIAPLEEIPEEEEELTP